jgi:signal transduction histidine kinase
VAAALLGWAFLLASGPADYDAAKLIVAAALMAVVVGAAVLLPWERLPAWPQMIPPLAFFAVVYLIRDGAEGAGAGYTALNLLPVLWLALYGSRAGVWLAITVFALAQVIFALSHGESGEWTRVFVGTAVASLIGFTTHGLVRRITEQAADLEAIAQIPRGLAGVADVDAARQAICDSVIDICGGVASFLYELDEDRALVPVAAAGAGAGLDLPPIPLTARDSAPVIALASREPYFAADARRDRLVPQERIEATGAVSAMWHPVVRGGVPVAVLSVGWAHRVGRISDRAAVALGLLAAEAAATIERADLLARRERQVAELRELDELKSDFVSAASHELRTPITSIRGYIDILTEGEAGPLNEEQAEFLGVVDRNAARLQALVNDLLVISRIESGRLELAVGEFDLGALVQRVCQSFEPQLAQQRLRLEAAVPAGLAVDGDRGRIEQVIVNLVSNAVKFTPPDGRIAIEARESAEQVALSVSDTGIGMSERDRVRLFEKFFRAESAREQAVSGTGLGLAICKGILEAHGGRIEVESTLGRGTVVTIVLPRRDTRPEERTDGAHRATRAEDRAGRR